MAYKTWAVGDILTAADMNAMVRDQTITICTSTTHPSGAVLGKFVYETDTGQIRRSDGSGGWTLMTMMTPPAWEMSGGNGQSIGAGSSVQYIPTVSVENVGLSAFTLSPAAVTIAIPGRYVVSQGLNLDTASYGTVYRKNPWIEVIRSSVRYRVISSNPMVSDFMEQSLNVCGTLRLNAGDILKAWIYQDNGNGTLHVSDTASKANFFSGTWIAP